MVNTTSETPAPVTNGDGNGNGQAAKPPRRELMVVNDSPGEECRIAILEDHHLEELYTERTATATNVGNIYKGRVTNVEPAIQAAFVDYGRGAAGFLHISDLHPRYFPGEKRTERVGKKIPRRARPPIQEALKRGDEVLVQVLKEGVGTKGPTLTSYLSIPGRLLVMMPDMDRVGVSRKVEDPEERRRMREILDSLELPPGFGFILRTAGFEASKTDLTRDVAYLTRLWSVMDRRIKEVGAPCELYTESDLFVRTLRDLLRPSIEAIVVDSESAHTRATALLRVVAPRSAPKLIRFTGRAPIFHAFDVERQIDLIHCREVPLPSGGKLVIDQTEALVAIDVNSGRSRSARDAETNAYRTNCEAVDEICRQLRLRDLGGLVVNDLIDMHQARHRRSIEDRFKAGLERDRARTTMLRISEFGIVELTRQRMRPSLRKSHFMPCPHCDGRGEIKTPESVGADATRQAGYLLQFDRVRRVEIVCSSRVASVLLSGKRRELVSMEDLSGKRISVRVSDAIAIDRVDFYAYDERNADVDVSKLPAARVPTIAELEAAELKAADRTVAAVPGTAAEAGRSRRRRRRSSRPADASDIALEQPDLLDEELLEEAPPRDEPLEDEQGREQPPRSGRRRRSRRRRGGRRVEAGFETGSEAGFEAEDRVEPAAPAAEAEVEPEAPLEPASPIRVHELAHELGVTSKEVLERVRQDETAEVKSHMSSLPGLAADLLRKFFGRRAPAVRAPQIVTMIPVPAPAPELEPEPAAEAPPAEIFDGASAPQEQRKKSGRRRRRRGGRGRSEAHAQAPFAQAPFAETSFDEDSPPSRESAEGPGAAAPDQPPAEGRRKRRGRRGGRRRRKAREAAAAGASGPPPAISAARNGEAPAPGVTSKPHPEPRSTAAPSRPLLYRSRRAISPVQRPGGDQESDE